MKKILVIIMSIALLMGVYNINVSTKTTEEAVVYENFLATAFEDETYDTYNGNADVIERDIEAEEKEVQAKIEAKKNMPLNAGNIEVINYGVVNFKTKPNETINTYYTSALTGQSGYTNGYYGADGAFIGYSDDGSKVKFKMAGVIGWVSTADVEILDYEDTTKVQSVSHYKVENGKLYHKGTTDISKPYYSMANMVGYKQSYMEEGKVYYSYDGHYFYLTYKDMIDDYKNDSVERAINKDAPYYNYYQYLSHRTKTNISSEMLDAYTNAIIKNKANGSKSKMIGMGVYFVNYQEIYGTNALLMYALAAHESGWGLSSISQNKNNLFGHAAYDASAGDSAMGYFSPQKSIYSHSRYFVSEGYLDPKDASGRYYGAHFGDKESGMNVKYASDPYWGEKAASMVWSIYNAYTNSNDANKYTIAIQKGSSSVNVRKEATTASTALYTTRACAHFPYIVLASVNGESLSGNATWYKIQSDTTMKDDRSAMTQDNGLYNFDLYYAYVHSSLINIVSLGTNKGPDYQLVIPEMPSEEEEKPAPEPEVVYPQGDVNGDNEVKPSDYVLVKNHIMETKLLVGEELKRADVNKDGKVSPADYVTIKNIIMK